MSIPKLLFVAPAVGRYSEVWMYRQMCGLDGFDVRVAAPQYDDPPGHPERGFRFVRCPKPRLGRRETSPLRRIKHAVRRLGRRDLGGMDAGREEAVFWRRELRDHRPDMALIHYGDLGVHYAPMLIRHRIPFAVHFNGYDLSRLTRNPDYVRRLTAIGHRASALFVVADYMRDFLRGRGIAEEKIIYQPYGVPRDLLRGSPRTSDAGGPCRFLAVGRLTPKKAPVQTIEAFAACRRRFPDATLRIVGDGALMEACRRRVDELGVRDAVEFAGPLPFTAVREAFDLASVFVQHSITSEDGNREGWPVSVAEAAAAGLPVVATRHAGIPQQVVDGRTGILTDEGDTDAMAAAMIRLAGDAELRRSMSTEATRHIGRWTSQRQVAALNGHLRRCFHAASRKFDPDAAVDPTPKRQAA